MDETKNLQSRAVKSYSTQELRLGDLQAYQTYNLNQTIQSNNVISNQWRRKKSRNSSCTSRIFKERLKTAPCSVNEFAFGNLENKNPKRRNVHSPQMQMGSKLGILR